MGLISGSGGGKAAGRRCAHAERGAVFAPGWKLGQIFSIHPSIKFYE